jgi:hypothetical protein
MPGEPTQLYRTLRVLTRALLRIFYRHVEVTGLEHLDPDAPTILAATHPNSILDPLLLGLVEDRPGHGDHRRAARERGPRHGQLAGRAYCLGPAHRRRLPMVGRARSDPLRPYPGAGRLYRFGPRASMRRLFHGRSLLLLRARRRRLAHELAGLRTEYLAAHPEQAAASLAKSSQGPV